MVAGALMGAAVGLKLTNATYAASLLAAVVTACPRDRIIRTVLVFGLAGVAGFLITAGWWMAMLWHHYQNPFFPYFNSVFQSRWLEGVPDFISSGTGADINFLPGSVLEALMYPVKWATIDLEAFNRRELSEYTSSEYYFRDARVLVALLLAVMWVALRLSRIRKFDRVRLSDKQIFLTVFAGASFSLWMGLFAIQRYLIPLEALSGVIIMILIMSLVPRRGVALGVFAGISIALLAWTRPAAYGEIPFRDRMIWDTGLSTLHVPNALYVMIGGEPMAFVIPAFPKDTRFVRIGGNMQLSPSKGLGEYANQLISNHDGPLRTFSAGGQIPSGHLRVLQDFGLMIDGDCRTVEGPDKPLTSCQIRRIR
jgi:hypothetical protein